MKTQIRTVLRSALVLGALATATSAAAAAKTFDFADPKGVNNAQFTLDAPLEIISGYANGVRGTVAFDPAKPETLTGTIVVDAKSLSVGNPLMQEHLQGPNWLDVAQYPEITFALERFEVTKSTPKGIEGTAHGTFTLHGVSKEIAVPVTLSYLPGKLGARLNDASLAGDLLVVRSDFTLNRSDFGIMPGQATDKVDETVQIALRIVGAHQG